MLKLTRTCFSFLVVVTLSRSLVGVLPFPSEIPLAYFSFSEPRFDFDRWERSPWKRCSQRALESFSLSLARQPRWKKSPKRISFLSLQAIFSYFRSLIHFKVHSGCYPKPCDSSNQNEYLRSTPYSFHTSELMPWKWMIVSGSHGQCLGLIF